MNTINKALQKFFSPQGENQNTADFFKQFQRLWEKRQVSAQEQKVLDAYQQLKNMYTDPASLSTRTLLSSKRLHRFGI